MKYQQILLLLALLLIPLGITAKTICMSTPSTSLVVNATEGQDLEFLYYGAHLSDTDVTDLIASGTPNTAAYPVFGFNYDKEAALSVRHDDGDMTLQMTPYNHNVDYHKLTDYASRVLYLEAVN